MSASHDERTRIEGEGEGSPEALEASAFAEGPDASSTQLEVGLLRSEATGPSISFESLTGEQVRSLSASLASTVAVQNEQLTRGRAATVMSLVAAVLTFIALRFPKEHAPHGQLISDVALGMVVLTGLVLAWRQRQGLFAPREVVWLGAVATLATLALIYDVGVFSPVVAVLFLIVFFFGLSDDTRLSHGVFAIAAGGYFVLAALAIAGVFDTGLSMVPLDRADRVALIALSTVMEVFFFMTYWLARMSRKATVEAMMRLELAQKQVRQREALLNEARAEMRDAKNAGRIGRLTGQDVGPYCMGEVIGRGAMGEVYEAIERQGQERAAIKVLHAHMVGSERHVERFFREASITSALDSDHIVDMIDRGFAQDGSPYLAMHLLRGHDLGWHIRDRGRFSLPDAVELVAALARGLAVAHDAGVVHRDLKPSNVFFDDASKTWKILDFGISKVQESGGTLTGGDAIGTPSYMAPEQASGEDVDLRADVFSLGVIAYRVLTGRPAFTGRDALATMMAVIKEQPIRPGALAPLSEEVDDVIAIALAKSPEHRFSNARQLAKALFGASRADLPATLRRRAQRLISVRPWKRDVANVTKVGQRANQDLETRVE